MIVMIAYKPMSGTYENGYYPSECHKHTVDDVSELEPYFVKYLDRSERAKDEADFEIEVTEYSVYTGMLSTAVRYHGRGSDYTAIGLDVVDIIRGAEAKIQEGEDRRRREYEALRLTQGIANSKSIIKHAQNAIEEHKNKIEEQKRILQTLGVYTLN